MVLLLKGIQSLFMTSPACRLHGHQISLQHVLALPRGLLSVEDPQNTSPGRCTALILNHLSWFVSMRSSNSTLKSSGMISILWPFCSLYPRSYLFTNFPQLKKSCCGSLSLCLLAQPGKVLDLYGPVATPPVFLCLWSFKVYSSCVATGESRNLNGQSLQTLHHCVISACLHS